jgi:hypothetical protein
MFKQLTELKFLKSCLFILNLDLNPIIINQGTDYYFDSKDFGYFVDKSVLISDDNKY